MDARRKTRARSAMWEYYTQQTPGKAVCKTCRDVVSMGGTMAKSANTSNLWSHLRIHHHDLYKSAQTSEPESEQGATSTLGMRGIPVLEKYRYLLYFKRYDIIILHNSVYAAVAKCTCRWQCFPNCFATGKM